MKFSSFLAALVGVASVLSAAVPTQLGLDYVIEEFPEDPDVVDIYNGDSITLAYTIANNNEQPVQIVGVGGTFKNPSTNEVSTNLTTGNVGPLTLEQGQTQKFKQSISLNLVPDHYVLSPIVYVMVDQELVSFEARTQLASISDKPISIFNPQLLFLELVLLATIGALGYLGYETFGKSYFKGAAPTKKPVRAPKASSPDAAKSFDSSWIPEGHLKKKTKRTN